MRLGTADARARFAQQRVVRLATVRPDGSPHLVPIVFALDGDTLYFAIDGKPKSTLSLQRLDNVAADPRVCLLADRYDDDWSQLWWVRADGLARVVEPQQSLQQAIDLLAARYPQYRQQPPPGPVVSVEITRWTGWSVQ